MGGQLCDLVAVKDDRLVYRACSLAFARCVGLESPDQIIGKTDFDLFPGELAREQMALDSQTMFSAKTDISAVELQINNGAHKRGMVLRNPVLADNKQVRGVDLRLISGQGYCDADNDPLTNLNIDYGLLLQDGVQGCLIISNTTVLFANDNAAHALGYASAQSLIHRVPVSRLLGETEYKKACDAAAKTFHTGAGFARSRVTLTAVSRTKGEIRLVVRATQVDWGASRVLLLSFIDVAIPDALARYARSHSLPTVGKTQQPALVATPALEFETNGESSALRASEVRPVASSNLTGEISSFPRQLVNRLRTNEQRFRHYASAASDFFWEVDASLTFRVVSQGFLKVLGLRREEIIGKTHLQLLEHPGNVNDGSLWKEHVQQLEDALPFRDFEFRWSVRGDTRVVRISGIPVFNRQRQFVGYRGAGCDVTASVRQAETTAYHANHDALTGLFNRRSFENTVHEALNASRESREAHALCFLDLDSFKIVNDTCGHQAGDELLRQLTQLFRSLVRKSDILARLGGDEFGVLLYKCGVAQALKLANQIRHEVENLHFLWDDYRFSIGVSIGLVVVDDRWESIDSLFAAADSACYIAKNEGRNRVVVYREGQGNSSNRKVATHWVAEINTALDAGRMCLARQKVTPLHNQTDSLIFEMFLRLQMANGEMVNPGLFMPSAERYGLTSALDERAIELTLSWLSTNPAIHEQICHVSINLSAGSCTDTDFTDALVKNIVSSGVEPSKLCFEISETTAIANLSKISDFMNDLAEIGCRFCIDDFGSGLSSFSFLRKLPVDFIKIDGHLVRDVLKDPTDFTMVKAISEISKSMGTKTIAEFVESENLLDAVTEIGIDFGQGSHLGEPELITCVDALTQ